MLIIFRRGRRPGLAQRRIVEGGNRGERSNEREIGRCGFDAMSEPKADAFAADLCRVKRSRRKLAQPNLDVDRWNFENELDVPVLHQDLQTLDVDASRPKRPGLPKIDLDRVRRSKQPPHAAERKKGVRGDRIGNTGDENANHDKAHHAQTGRTPSLVQTSTLFPSGLVKKHDLYPGATDAGLARTSGFGRKASCTNAPLRQRSCSRVDPPPLWLPSAQ